MFERTVDRARGRWRGVLATLGIDDALLDGKHHGCPLCGGSDRWRWDDKRGDGTWICNQCGAGNGLQLVMKFQGWDFQQAVKRIDEIVGTVQVVPIKSGLSTKQVRNACNKLWSASRPIQHNDPVDCYLQSRRIALKTFPPDLRIHYDGEYPCMIAMIRAPDGKPSSLHRTYLTNAGQKAPFETMRKTMPGEIAKGSAVRLSDYETTPHRSPFLGIAEGIETAFSATLLFGVPCWAALSTALLAGWQPPSNAKIIIFSDNDANFAGQTAAYSLAKTLVVRKFVVEVKLPAIAGHDFNDALGYIEPQEVTDARSNS